MAIDQTEVRLAFRAVLLAIAGMIPRERIAWENQPFSPPNPSKSWIKETLIVVDEQRVASGMDCLWGIMQYDVVVPKGGGTGEAESLAGLIQDAFPAASGITDPEIAIDKCRRQSGGDFGALEADRNTWFGIPVQINFRTYAITS